MTFLVFDDRGQGAYFVLLIVSALVSIVAIVLRFVATSRTRRKPGLEDWLAFAAVVVFLSRVGVAFNGNRQSDSITLLLVRGMLTFVYIFTALVIINGRGLELADDRASYENAFKVYSNCMLVLSELAV